MSESEISDRDNGLGIIFMLDGVVAAYVSGCKAGLASKRKRQSNINCMSPSATPLRSSWAKPSGKFSIRFATSPVESIGTRNETGNKRHRKG
jgi:hypothetical protein